MKVLWEELESLNALPPITTITSEIHLFLKTLQTHMDEQNLFSFLMVILMILCQPIEVTYLCYNLYLLWMRHVTCCNKRKIKERFLVTLK